MRRLFPRKGICLLYTSAPCDENIVIPYQEVISDFYVRLRVPNVTAAKKAITHLFGEVSYLSRREQPENELAFTSGMLSEGELENKLSALVLQDVDVLGRIHIVDY